MAALRVFGTVGKATTRIMVDAIVHSVGAGLPADVLVLLSQDDEGHQALAGLDEPSRIVVNADAVSTSSLPASAVTFGLSRTAALSASDLDATMDGTVFTLIADGIQRQVHLKVLGEHQVTNALAALAAARACDIPLDGAIAALEKLDTLGRARMERLQAADDIIVINDAVSAGPLSVAAALKALAQISAGRRSVAVLGELASGAEDSQAAHDRIGRLIVRLNVKKLVVVGHAARHIHNAAGLEGSWDGESVLVDTPGEAYDLLRDELRNQDVVLVKASEGSGLDSLADRLAGVAR
ncbi:MAG TPA: cyanophycin synthetase [Homoserinimonas sp.]|nr:cyanophycin synthetase [Homoserinimonas sp.]